MPHIIFPNASKFLEPSFLRRATQFSLMVLWISFAFSTALMQIGFYSAFVFWLLLKCREGWQWPRIDRQLLLPLIIFSSISILSVFWSEYPNESLRGILKILRQVMSFIMIPDVFTTRQDIRRLERIALVMFGILVLDGFIQYYFGKDVLRGVPLQISNSGGRVSAAFKTYGLFACYLLCVIPWMAALGVKFWKENKRPLSLLIIALALAGIVLLFLTRSRGAMLAFAAGTGLLFFLYSRKRILFLLMFLAGTTTLFFLPQSFLIHKNIEGKEQSLYERYYLWDRALAVVREKPWGGTGINTYAKAHGKYDKRLKPKLLPIRGTLYSVRQNPDGSVSFVQGDLEWRSDPQQKKIMIEGKLYDIHLKSEGEYLISDDIVVRNYYAHNGYLQLAAETGVASLLFFVLFLGLYFFKGLRFLYVNKQKGNAEVPFGILIGTTNFLFFACVDTVLHNTQAVLIFWYLAGLLQAYQNIAAKETVLDSSAARLYPNQLPEQKL